MNKVIYIIFFTFLIISIFAKNYKGAEVFSSEMVKYGKFEIRMMVVSQKGVVSSFFLYDNKSWQGLPYMWREIDIEAIGREKDLFQTNIITGHSQSRITSEKVYELKDLSNKYHTFTIEWTPDYVAWYYDGLLIRKDDLTDSEQVKDLQDTPQTYRLNLWIAEWVDWVGKFNKKVLPVYQYINWIKYYKYTPGKGEDGSDFTLEWTDNFDEFDTSRWAKGDWSFDGNLVDFSPENAVVKDGYLILCLTDNKNKGHKGKVSKDTE